MSTAADRLDDTFPHGTPDGYRQGCRGSICPALLPCRDVYTRYQGDFAFHRAINAGTPLVEILAADAAEHAGVEARDRAANRAHRKAAAAPVTPREPRPPRTPRAPRRAPAPTPVPVDPAAELARAREQFTARRDQLRAEVRAARSGVARLQRTLDRAIAKLTDHLATKPQKPNRAPQPRGPHSKIDDADVVRLYQAGMTDDAIGAELGVTGQRIWQIRRRLSLPAHRGRRAA